MINSFIPYYAHAELFSSLVSLRLEKCLICSVVAHTQTVSYFSLAIILDRTSFTSWPFTIATICIFSSDFLINKLIWLLIYIKVWIIAYWTLLLSDTWEAKFKSFFVTQSFELGLCHGLVWIYLIWELNQALS